MGNSIQRARDNDPTVTHIEFMPFDKGDLSFIENNTHVTDVKIMSGITNIFHISRNATVKRLILDNCDVEDLTPLRKNVTLTVVSITRAKIRDISPLHDNVTLMSLDLRDNHIEDISSLELNRTIKYLDLSHNDIQSGIALWGNTSLLYLQIHHNPLPVWQIVALHNMVTYNSCNNMNRGVTLRSIALQSLKLLEKLRD